ncbi:MAG: hypothetical protein NTX66_03250, partial [Candidatus Falkowbacteria bacterium]|nr:hypothetical protein [Candidatus Falkowbacteria bacterium]
TKKASDFFAKTFSPTRENTNNLLRQAWLSLAPSCLTSLLWPNIHVFLRTIGWQKQFGPLGSEWLPGDNAALDNLSDKLGKSKSWTEGCLLVGLDFGCLLLIVSILFIISLIVNVVTNPLAALKAILSYLGSFLWGS